MGTSVSRVGERLRSLSSSSSKVGSRSELAAVQVGMVLGGGDVVAEFAEVEGVHCEVGAYWVHGEEEWRFSGRGIEGRCEIETAVNDSRSCCLM